MNKSSQRPGASSLYLVIFILIVAVLGLLAWKYQEALGLKVTKINLTGVLPKNKINKSNSIYDSYEATIGDGGSGVYYTKLKDVVCDAAKSPDGRNHYFRISITFESPDKKDADKLMSDSKTLVAELRETVSTLQSGSSDQAQVMSYIKSDLGRKIKEKFGDAAVSDIYFEEILSQ